MTKYQAPPTTLNKLNKQQVEDFIKLTEQGWSNTLFHDQPNKDLNDVCISPDGLYYWETFQDFFNYVTTITETSNIIDANSKLYKILPITPEGAVYSGAEEGINANIPDKNTLDRDVELADKKLPKQKTDYNESNRLVRNAIQTKIDNQKNLNQQKIEQNESNQSQTITQEPEIIGEDSSADALFRKTGRQVVVTDNNFEDFTPTPTYVPTITPTTMSPKQEYISEPKRKETIEIVNNIQKGIEERSIKEQQIKASVQEKQKEYLSNVSKAREIKDVLEKAEIKTKVWVKVEPPPEPTPQIKVLRDRLQSQANANPKGFIEDVSKVVQKNTSLQSLPKDQAKIIADETAYNLYESVVTTSSPLIPIGITHEVINTPGVLDGITKDKKQQLLIQKANVEISNSKLGQYNLWRKLTKEQNLKVEVSLTERPGYTEVNVNELLNNETITPYISSYENQNSTLDSLEDFGKDRIKSEIINRVGQSVVNKISQLPEGNPLSQVYNHQLVQATLADVGFVPSTWTGVEGNFFVSTGHANVAGYFQKTFGIDFGLVEVSSLGVAGYSLAGGFEYYTTTALAVEYSGGIFAGEAFMGGAGAAMATETVGSAVGLGAETIAGFGGYTTSTITSTMAGVGTETIAGATAAGATTTAGVGIGTAGGVGIATVAGTQAIPGVGIAFAVATAAAMAVKKVFSKIAKLINWPKVKAFFDKNKEMFLLGGILTVGSFPAIGAISILIGGASIIATGSFAFSGLFTSFMSLFSSFGSLFLTIGAQFFAWFIGIIIFLTFTLYIINSGAYVVPPDLLSQSGGTIGSGIKVECTSEKGPVGVDGPTSSSPIANRAWEITYDLYQGFWCYWNRPPPAPAPYDKYFPNDTIKYPPDYNTSFDYEEYFRNPKPETWEQLQLFWCTYLVIRSYQYTHNSIVFDGADTNTKFMMNHFISLNRFIPAENATPDNIPPGSAIFFHVSSGHEGPNHVGVVYTVNRGGIVFVESNNGVKSESAFFKYNGTNSCTPLCLKNATPEECGCYAKTTGVGDIGAGPNRMIVLGFGLP